MRRRSVLGNTSPNAGFLFVRAESGSSTKVSPRFHYAQAQCFATALLGTRDFQGKPANPANSTPSDLLETCLHTTTAPLPPQPGFFFLRLPNGQYGPVSQLSRSEKCCTGPFNWSEAHCASEKVKRKIGPFQRKSL